MSGGGELEMFNSDVNSLGNDSLSDLLVDDDTDGSRVDVEDAAGSSVIVFVGHSLVDGTIDDDIDDISGFVGSEGLGNVDSSVHLETLSELVSGSALASVTLSHYLIN